MCQGHTHWVFIGCHGLLHRAGSFRHESQPGPARLGAEGMRVVGGVDEIPRVIVALHAAADLGKGTNVNVGIPNGGARTI